MLSDKNKKVSTISNYIEHFLTVVFVVTWYVSISAFSSLANVVTEIIGSTRGLIGRIKKYTSIIIKKKKKKYDEITLLSKLYHIA